MDNKILVSCTVLTYNSSATVLETLESIKQQTYEHIELIVSDDCSTDNTVEICQKWIEQNRNRFVRTELLTIEKNTGVSANVNRTLAVCKGEWKKWIAADDILFSNCIEDFVNFVKIHPAAKWVSSFVRLYHKTFDEENCYGKNMVFHRQFFEENVDKQLQIMARRNLIYAPSLFFNTSLIKDLGGCNILYGIEDYPLYMKLLENGYKCFFLEKETVGYRIHESLAHSNIHLFNYTTILEGRKARKDISAKYWTRKEYIVMEMLWIVQDLIMKFKMNNRKNIFACFVYKAANYITNKILMSEIRKIERN